MNTVPIEYQDAVIYAITPNKQCVGIKMFTEPINIDENCNSEMEQYIDQCVEQALEMKSSVENGACDIEMNDKIIHNPRSKCVDIDVLVSLQSRCTDQNLHLKMENLFIDLGLTLTQAVQVAKLQYDMCNICLKEIVRISNKLTSVMLKKHPQIVRMVANLCRYSETELCRSEALSARSLVIQKDAKDVLTEFQKILGFTGTNNEFLRWFNDSVKVFHDLTANMSEEERYKLTIDPESEIVDKI